MITSSFDNSKPIITPKYFCSDSDVADIAIGTFSDAILKEARYIYYNRRIGELTSANGARPVYLLDVEGRKVVMFMLGVGAPMAAAEFEEIHHMTGVTKFITFGSCGSLDKIRTSNRYVIPTEAYRDEGTSYHYAPPSDYIAVKNWEVVESILTNMGIPVVCGRVWTTDAFYRETEEQAAKRRADGCVAVDMEVSALQAVCNLYGWKFYTFLQPGDVLEERQYTNDKLQNANDDIAKLGIAFEIAKHI